MTVDAIALGNQVVALRKSKCNEEALDLFITDETYLEVPTIFSTDKMTGREKIMKRWKKEDKDGLRFIREDPFTLVKPGVIQRTVVGEMLILKLTVTHTIHFTPEGKIDKMFVKKQ